jgi:hypothetical protein
MSDEPEGDLQFDRADFEGVAKASALCAACGQTIWTVYYAANGRVLCERCKTVLDRAANQGSGAGRFLRATLYGVGAGAVGSGIWYAVRAATGYEVGIIAVAVGFMVGAAVRKGSSGRGGWRYQALAMLLTYGSIVSAYVPDIVSELRKMGQAKATTAGSPAPGAAGSGARTTEPSTAPSPEPTTTGKAAEAPRPVGLGRSLLGVGVAVAFLLALAFAAPFLGGFQNIMGIVIIGIGVYEAWKLNKRQVLEIKGPHQVGTAEHG